MKLCNDQDVLQMLKYVDKYKDNDDDVIEDVSEDKWLQKSLRLLGRRKKDAVENDNVVEFSMNQFDMTSYSQESDFLVDPDNMIDDVEMDMAEFRRNIDANAEWVGSKEIVEVVEEGFEDEEVDHEDFDSGSDSEYKGEKKKALKMFNKMNKANAQSSDQLQKQYEVGISKQKVFRAKKIAQERLKGPLKDGFKAGKRDLLVFDGCFLSGTYLGWILTAVGVDPNNGIYTLAYAIVESENKDSWKWFMWKLEGGQMYKEMLWRCAITSTVQRFDKHMDKLKDLREKLKNG
ncbi:transposase, MuDR [Tanacetum coccineum]|uniref:Transposase, MuDR n=1 Tax=Tanacetum coccineum TaxID=301880 RepID=A0ABQ5H736_9ASTR